VGLRVLVLVGKSLSIETWVAGGIGRSEWEKCFGIAQICEWFVIFLEICWINQIIINAHSFNLIKKRHKLKISKAWCITGYMDIIFGWFGVRESKSEIIFDRAPMGAKLRVWPCKIWANSNDMDIIFGWFGVSALAWLGPKNYLDLPKPKSIII
jgi:hypothetical protein